MCHFQQSNLPPKDICREISVPQLYHWVFPHYSYLNRIIIDDVLAVWLTRDCIKQWRVFQRCEEYLSAGLLLHFRLLLRRHDHDGFLHLRHECLLHSYAHSSSDDLSHGISCPQKQQFHSNLWSSMPCRRMLNDIHSYQMDLPVAQIATPVDRQVQWETSIRKLHVIQDLLPNVRSSFYVPGML